MVYSGEGIHPTAVIAAGAILGDGCAVGPYSVIGPSVVLGARNRIGSHVVIEGNTTIGDDNVVYQFASIGAEPQDLKFKGEKSTLKIGNKNIIREYVTLQPGTAGGGMRTLIGDGNLFMANTHVGHDSIIGDGNVFANSAAISGHVIVGNRVTIGGLSGIHQFVRIGDLAILGGGSMVTKDIPPFTMAQGDRAELIGLNLVGLERKGFSEDQISILKSLFRNTLRAKGLLKDKVSQSREQTKNFEAGNFFLDFIASSERGVALPRRTKGDA